MSTNFFGEYDAQHGADLAPPAHPAEPRHFLQPGQAHGAGGLSQLPGYAQKEYLTKLKRSYGAGAAQIGQMFGITTEDACELMRESGVSAKGKRAANADELWTAFLGDYNLPELAVFRAGFERVMHVCPLQLDIVDRLINRYSNEGDLVLDPFGGLGTVALEAIKAKRRGYSIELNNDYFLDAVGYLRDYEDTSCQTMSLFDLTDETT